jgi:hypothetical protein
VESVAAEPDRRVDEDAAALGIEQLRCLGEQYRFMGKKNRLLRAL